MTSQARGGALVGRSLRRQRARIKVSLSPAAGFWKVKVRTLLLIIEHQQRGPMESSFQARAARRAALRRSCRWRREGLARRSSRPCRSADVTQAKRHAGPSGERVRIASSILTCMSVSWPLIASRWSAPGSAARWDRGRAGDAEHDGDQADDQNSGEELAADAGAARRAWRVRSGPAGASASTSALPRSGNARSALPPSASALPPPVVSFASAPAIGSFIQSQVPTGLVDRCALAAHRRGGWSSEQAGKRPRYRTASDAPVCTCS